MSIELKVKAKHLASEGRIIRKEERKQLGYGRYLLRTQQAEASEIPYAQHLKLRNHRIFTVRPAARLTGIARGYIKGKRYASVEQPKTDLKTHQITEIAKMVSIYNGEVDLKEAQTNIKRWLLQ